MCFLSLLNLPEILFFLSGQSPKSVSIGWEWFYRLLYLDAWSSISGTVCEGLRCVALLDELCHWEPVLKFNPPISFSFCLVVVVPWNSGDMEKFLLFSGFYICNLICKHSKKQKMRSLHFAFVSSKFYVIACLLNGAWLLAYGAPGK